MLLKKNRLLLLSLTLLFSLESTAGKYRQAEVHMKPSETINTQVSITKNKKEMQFEHRQQNDRQTYEDFLKEQEAEEKFLYGNLVHSAGKRIYRDKDDENEGDKNTEDDEEGEDAEEKRKKEEEEENAALSPEEKEAAAQNIEEKRKEELQIDDYLMGILSLAFVSLITIGLWSFYKHFLDSSDTETKSLIHSQVMEAAASASVKEEKPQESFVQNSMGRSYEKLKAEYVKRKQQTFAGKGRQQSPPTTPSTGASTRYGTQTDKTQIATTNNAKTYDDENDEKSEGGEHTSEFVFPTRHFVAQSDVEMQEQDLK